ncbi:MAG: L,D-transpeptidase family protein [Pseudomonadales bacterium]
MGKMVAGAVVCLVMITSLPASAQSGSSRDLRQFFEALDAGASPSLAGRLLYQPEALAAFYRQRDHAPLWVDGGPLHDALPELVLAIRDSSGHGLNSANYHDEALLTLSGPRPPAADLAAELLASDAFFRLAQHRANGAVAPGVLDPEWHLVRSEIDPAAVLADLAGSGGSLTRTLDDLWPHSDEYWALVAHRARLLAMGNPEVVKVPAGPILRPGQSGPRILTLKQRLLGPGDHDDAYDASLRAAVTDFQRAASLEPDGLVGAATLDVMNASNFSWIDRIDANLERWRWLPRDLPETYIRVNIASFTLRVLDRGEEALRMDVIVGRPYRRTPTFTSPMRYMVFNPFWNVPRRIAVQDKLPDLRSDATAMAMQGYEAKADGTESWVPVDAVDWSGINRSNFRYQLRQRPGPQNALGQVKFMMPNDFAVYLHDTPTRDLFARHERGFSSGCVRLSQPQELARWLLAYDGRQQQADQVSDLLDGGDPEVVYLRQPIPTYLVYFTALADDQGAVSFRRDLYERDGAIVSALRAQS